MIQPFKKNTEKGFSLIELLFVIVVVAFIASFAFSRFLSTREDAGSGERTLEQVASRIQMRRTEAIRLNGLRVATSIETETAPLVEINFADLATTASLVIDGTDADDDGLDDASGESLTRLVGNYWQYAYRADALAPATEWNINEQENSNLIASGSGGRGIPVTRIGFDGDGRAYGYLDGTWRDFPTGALMDEQKPPFWAVYMSKGEQGNIAVAVAVYPSGSIEKFRFDGNTWRGWRGRETE